MGLKYSYTEIQSNEKLQRRPMVIKAHPLDHSSMAKKASGSKPYKPRQSANAPTLPLFLREWRLYKDLTQERVAERAEMSVSSISNLENGEQGPSDNSLAALAHAYDCAVADLFRNPLQPDYQLWRIITGMKPDQREQALRIIRALTGEAA